MAKVFSTKRELTTKSYSLKGRLRLFNGTVSPTELENRLRRTQRQMLRMIVGSTRRRTNTTQNGSNNEHHNDTHMNDATQPTLLNTTDDKGNDSDNDSNASDVNSETPPLDIPIDNNNDDHNMEPWQDFIRRCTHEAEALITSMGIEDWITQQRRMKWRWAQKLATVDTHKWSYYAITWEPALCPQHNAQRCQARPKKRWIDDITHFLSTINNTTHNIHLQQPTPPSTTNEIHEDEGGQTSTNHNVSNNDSTAINRCGSCAVDWLIVAQNHHTWHHLEYAYVNRSVCKIASFGRSWQPPYSPLWISRMWANANIC